MGKVKRWASSWSSGIDRASGRVSGPELAGIADVHEHVVGELAAHLDLRDPLADVARHLRPQATAPGRPSSVTIARPAACQASLPPATLTAP